MERQVWHNGKFIPESEAKISIYDSAMMFGDTVFEMTRSFNKKQFKLKEHLDRLYNGLKILRIPIQYTQEELTHAINEAIEINNPLFENDDEHRVMIDITRGLLGLYQGKVNVEKGTNVMIAVFPLRWTVVGMGKLFDEGINAVIPSQRTLSSKHIDPKIKNRSRIHYLMANIETSLYKGENNWALLLDEDDYISEGTGDNFFIVKDNKIITPEGRNILRGISREYIFELCKELNIECIEKNIEPYDVYTADEAFMTGTPFCMLPVTSLNSIKIGNDTKIFNILLEHWGKKVGINIKEQIKRWNTNEIIQGATPYQFK